jgi:hypothetical protein
MSTDDFSRISQLARTLARYPESAKAWADERARLAIIRGNRATLEIREADDSAGRDYRATLDRVKVLEKPCDDYVRLQDELAQLLATHLPQTYSACPLIRQPTLDSRTHPHLSDGFDWKEYWRQLDDVGRDLLIARDKPIALRPPRKKYSSGHDEGSGVWLPSPLPLSTIASVMGEDRGRTKRLLSCDGLIQKSAEAWTCRIDKGAALKFRGKLYEVAKAYKKNPDGAKNNAKSRTGGRSRVKVRTKSPGRISP